MLLITSLVLGIWFSYVGYKLSSWKWEDLWAGAFWGLIIVLCISLVLIPVMRADVIAGILEVGAVRQTLETARQSNISEIERATTLNEVIEMNKWISRVQYWQQNEWVSVYYPKQVMELEFIK